MLDIDLDKDYKLKSDSMCYILSVKTKPKKAGEEGVYRDIKFAGKLEYILKAYKELKIRKSNCKTMEGLLRKIEEVDKHIEKVMKGN